LDKSIRDLVFLSYAKEDQEIVMRIYKGLKKRNLKVWFDKQDMKKGPWKPQLFNAISNSRDFIICISKVAIEKMHGKRGMQQEEFSFAYNLAMNQPESEFCIVPVRIEDCDRGDLRIMSYHQYDLFNDFEREIDKLAIHLGGISLSDSKAKAERTNEKKLIESLIEKSNLLGFSKEFKKALLLIDAAINIESNNQIAWNNKGFFLYELKKYKKALQSYEKALEINPDFYVAWNNKGMAYKELRYFKKSIECFHKAIEINPEFHQALNNIGLLAFEMNQYQMALKIFNRSIKIKPDNCKSWYNRGAALRFLEKNEEAIKSYNKAIEINPDFHKAWWHKGMVLKKLGCEEEAKEAFKISDEKEKYDQTL